MVAGYEHDTAKTVDIAAVVNVALMLSLYRYRVKRAANLTTPFTAVWNLILAKEVINKTDIYPAALARVCLRKRT